MSFHINFDLGKDNYNNTLTKLAQFGTEGHEWLISKQSKDGVEWKVIGKPRWIVRLLYSLFGWNPGVEKVVNIVDEFFKVHKDQEYIYSDDTLDLLNTLVKKKAFTPRLFEIRDSVFVEIKETATFASKLELFNEEKKKMLEIYQARFESLQEQNSLAEETYEVKMGVLNSKYKIQKMLLKCNYSDEERKLQQALEENHRKKEEEVEAKRLQLNHEIFVLNTKIADLTNQIPVADTLIIGAEGKTVLTHLSILARQFSSLEVAQQQHKDNQIKIGVDLSEELKQKYPKVTHCLDYSNTPIEVIIKCVSLAERLDSQRHLDEIETITQTTRINPFDQLTKTELFSLYMFVTSLDPVLTPGSFKSLCFLQLGSLFSLEDWAEILSIDSLGEDPLKTRAFEGIVKRFDECLKQPALLHKVSHADMIRIVQRDDLKINSEEELQSFLQVWGEHKKTKRQSVNDFLKESIDVDGSNQSLLENVRSEYFSKEVRRVNNNGSSQLSRKNRTQDFTIEMDPLTSIVQLNWKIKDPYANLIDLPIDFNVASPVFEFNGYRFKASLKCRNDQKNWMGYRYITFDCISHKNFPEVKYQILINGKKTEDRYQRLSTNFSNNAGFEVNFNHKINKKDKSATLTINLTLDS